MADLSFAERQTDARIPVDFFASVARVQGLRCLKESILTSRQFGVSVAKPMHRIKRVCVLTLLAVTVVGHSASAHDERPQILAPGWGILSYEAPVTRDLSAAADHGCRADGRVLLEDATPARPVRPDGGPLRAAELRLYAVR